MLGGYGDFMYQTGMIDEQQRDYVDQQTSLGQKLIQQQKWMEAFEVNPYYLLVFASVGYSSSDSPTLCQILGIFVCCGCRFVSIFFLVSGL